MKKAILFFVSLLFIVNGWAQTSISTEIGKGNWEEYYSLSDSLRNSNKPEEAIQILYSILDFLEPLEQDDNKYSIGIIRVYTSLSSIYVEVSDSLCVLYANKAIDMAPKSGSYKYLSRAYLFKYYGLYEQQNAILCNLALDSLIKYSLLSDNNDNLIEAYIGKCEILVIMGRQEEAYTYFLKAEETLPEVKDEFAQCSAYANLATNLESFDEDNEKILLYRLKSYEIAKRLKYIGFLIPAYYYLANTYYTVGDYKKSADFYKLLYDSTKKINETKLDERFTDAEAKFNTVQKDKEIALQKLNIIKQKGTRNKIVFSSIIMVLLVAGILLWYLYRHKKKKQLAEQELIKEQELNEARNRFLENISHEIRTPITLINGYLTLALEKTKDNPDLEKHLRSAMYSSKKVLDNANEILELQKLERGQIPIERSDIALGTFFRRVFYSFESLAKLKKIALVYRPENLSGISINSDKNRIEKILNNFISNAIKFSPTGSELIFEAGANHGLLTVKVIDSGPGIAVGEQGKIFDRFYQSSNTGNIGGVGVGLSLASDFAKSLGGNVSVESELGKGATFYFSLPVETFVGKDKVVEEKIEVGTKTKNQALTFDDKPKLLIVEDNPEMNQYLSEILCNEFTCDVAFDGAEGLQKTLSKKYSLIVSDVMMPQMDGFELKKRINALKNYKNIPFVFITAKAQLPSRIEGYNLGVDDYITKPFEKDELLARVRSLLINKKERDNWVRENPGVVDSDKNAEEQLLSKIKMAISNNLYPPSFSVSALAENVAYSPRQLGR
ncbi:MAG: hypothetical protein DRJ05_10805, partial [Bacteroidetes bacterium]